MKIDTARQLSLRGDACGERRLRAARRRFEPQRADVCEHIQHIKALDEKDRKVLALEKAAEELHNRATRFWASRCRVRQASTRRHGEHGESSPFTPPARRPKRVSLCLHSHASSPRLSRPQRRVSMLPASFVGLLFLFFQRCLLLPQSTQTNLGAHVGGFTGQAVANFRRSLFATKSPLGDNPITNASPVSARGVDFADTRVQRRKARCS